MDPLILGLFGLVLLILIIYTLIRARFEHVEMVYYSGMCEWLGLSFEFVKRMMRQGRFAEAEKYVLAAYDAKKNSLVTKGEKLFGLFPHSKYHGFPEFFERARELEVLDLRARLPLTGEMSVSERTMTVELVTPPEETRLPSPDSSEGELSEAIANFYAEWEFFVRNTSERTEKFVLLARKEQKKE